MTRTIIVQIQYQAQGRWVANISISFGYMSICLVGLNDILLPANPLPNGAAK